ncbi:MAG TPA: DUF3365 domain-containing protein [Vicinamibacterales bacterium]|nr:DUF3365 domain-containing protein [Vicinamibacterales bacterium]
MRGWMSLAGVVSLGAVVALAQAGQGPASYAVKNAPAAFQEPAARAMKAFDALQGTLSKRLMEEMKAGGPTRAIVVCRDEAQPLTARIAQESGLAMGRTSHRLRNPANAPRPWVQPLLEQAAGRKAAEVEPMVVDLGKTVGVVRPIGTAGACTTCHGPDEKRPPQLQRLLAEHYPRDEAVGFTEGDVRGFFWAEVPKGR